MSLFFLFIQQQQNVGMHSEQHLDVYSLIYVKNLLKLRNDLSVMYCSILCRKSLSHDFSITDQ